MQLHAEYNQVNNEYTAHRVLQAFDTAQFIRMTKGGADAIILSGDLNTEPHDLAYRIICGVAGLADACSANLNMVGTTECAKNSYTESISARKCPEGKRIDHILYLGSNNMKVCLLWYWQKVVAKNINLFFLNFLDGGDELWTSVAITNPREQFQLLWSRSNHGFI